jgi:hypothetical protein
MQKTRSLNRSFVENVKGRNDLGKHGTRLKVNIKMGFGIAMSKMVGF